MRVIAREIGMSSSGLHSFLYAKSKRGPQPRIHERLVRWYRTDTLSKKARKTRVVTSEVARIAAAVLLEHVEVEDQKKALKKLVAVLGEVSGKPRPRWLAELRRLADEAGEADE